MANDPQVPWTDEQWARVNQVVQEEAKRARVAATFLPLYGPLDADADFVRKQEILYAVPQRCARRALAARDAATQLSKAQDALEGRSRQDLRLLVRQERIARAQAILGRAALRHRRQGHDPACDAAGDCARAQRADGRSRVDERAGAVPPRGQCRRSARRRRGLQGTGAEPGESGRIRAPAAGTRRSAGHLANHRRAIASAEFGRQIPPDGSHIDRPELPSRRKRPAARQRNIQGHWPTGTEWTVRSVRRRCLVNNCFLSLQTPDPSSLVLPQDRIIPFLGGGPLLRSSTLDDFDRRGRCARRRAARAGRRFGHEPAVPSDQF